jgi:hypothetical protein
MSVQRRKKTCKEERREAEISQMQRRAVRTGPSCRVLACVCRRGKARSLMVNDGTKFGVPSSVWLETGCWMRARLGLGRRGHGKNKQSIRMHCELLR